MELAAGCGLAVLEECADQVLPKALGEPLGADLTSLIEAVPQGEGKREVCREQGVHLGDSRARLHGSARSCPVEAVRRATQRVEQVHSGGGGGLGCAKYGESDLAVAEEDANESVCGAHVPIHSELHDGSRDGERDNAAEHVCGGSEHDGAQDRCEDARDAGQGGVHEVAVAQGQH